MKCLRLAVLGAAALMSPAVLSAQSVVGAADNAEEIRSDFAAEQAWFERHEMPLQADGNLAGQLRVFDDSGTLIPARVKLFFLKNGTVVSQAGTDEEGNFQAAGLDEGTYSLVAAGPGKGGFAAIGVRVVKPIERPEPAKANTIGRSRLVSQPGVPPLRMNIATIPSQDVQTAFRLAQQQNAGGMGALNFGGGFPAGGFGPGGPGAGGVGGGGGGGVGGGLGFGGMMGPLVAAGAIAGTAVAASDGNAGGGVIGGDDTASNANP